MQWFRLVLPGFPDKVIAFDTLPERLVEGIELREGHGLPRNWKNFVPKGKRSIRGVPILNAQTGKTEIKGERTEEGHYFYVLEYKSINQDKEKWQAISDFVRRVVDTKFRLMDKLEDMALPMAPDCKSELSLEPEDVIERACIPIPAESRETLILVGPAPVVEEDDGEKKKHTCKLKGAAGRYAPEGECPRCDQLRAKKLVTV